MIDEEQPTQDRFTEASSLDVSASESPSPVSTPEVPSRPPKIGPEDTAANSVAPQNFSDKLRTPSQEEQGSDELQSRLVGGALIKEARLDRRWLSLSRAINL
ncbi:MAG: hypothetical protein AAFU85_27085, partial [Planctomycetota bacterium]